MVGEPGDPPPELGAEGQGGLPHARDDEEHHPGQREGARGRHEGDAEERASRADAAGRHVGTGRGRERSLRDQMVEDEHPGPQGEEGDEDEEKADIEGDGGGGHEHEEGEEAGVPQVLERAAAEESKQDEKEQQVDHAVQDALREVEEVEDDGHGRGHDEGPAQGRAHGHALAHLVDAPVAEEGQGHDGGAQGPEQPGQGEGAHAGTDEQIGDEPQGQEGAHQSSSTWSSRSERQPFSWVSGAARSGPG